MELPRRSFWQVKGGETAVTDTAFEQLVVQYQRLVYTVCYQMVRDPQTAEDLAQETFLSAYTHRDSCAADTAKPWLCRIAVNKAKDHLKSAYARRVDLTDDDEDDGYRQSASPPAEDLALDTVAQGEIAARIRTLREPYLKVSELYFLSEVPVEEIARRLGRPPKTVHTQLYRAKLILQKQLTEGGITHGTVRP